MYETRITGTGIDSMETIARKLGSKTKAEKAYRRALNETGRIARTATARALTKKTGLPARISKRALRPINASTGNLSYRLRGIGGDIRLKYFTARETQAGVSANPFGVRQKFKSAFIKGGRFPVSSRTPLKMGGHVFERGAKRSSPRPGQLRNKLNTVKSGVVIPQEMISTAVSSAFYETQRKRLGAAIERHVDLTMRGAMRGKR